MNGRYERIFFLPHILGLDDCPVVISAGALLRDHATRKVLVQLKLRNLSSLAVKAVKVKIHAYDTAKIELNGVDAFPYLDLNIPLGGEFGSQTPIPLPDAATRSFTVDILSVTFADGSGYFTPHQTVDASPETQAAKPVSGEILEKIAALNEERTAEVKRAEEAEEAKKARWKHLFRLSFVPLLLCVIAVAINYCYSYPMSKSLISRIRLNYREDKSVLFAFIIPCICILASWGSKRFSKAPTFAFAVCLAYIAVQVLSTVYIFNFDMTYGRSVVSLVSFMRSIGISDRVVQVMTQIAENIEGRFLLTWCQHLLQIILWTSGELSKGDRAYIIRDIVKIIYSLLYFAKNIFAAVILYLQVKSVKRGTL